MWLSRNNFSPSDALHADDLNNLANDQRAWGGDVNGGGHHLSNVILDSYFPGSVGSPLISVAHVIPAVGDAAAWISFDAAANSARWRVGHNNTAETGGNVGSDFAIGRHSDAGAFLDAPISIRRSDGLITMGTQKWTGAIDGGGVTLSNVVISGVMADPLTTKGDLVARGAATTRLPVGANGQVLTADSTQATGIKWAAPVGGVPTTRLISSGLGLSGGGDLSADRTLAVVPDTTVQQLRLSLGGALVAARRELNIVQGANVTLTLTDNGPSNRVDLTITAAGGGGGGMTDPTTTKGDLIVHGAATTRMPVGVDGQVLTADSTQALGVKWAAVSGGSGSQTPWTQNINAAGFQLQSLGNVGIGLAAPTSPLEISTVALNNTPGVGHFLRFSSSAVPLFGWRIDAANINLVLDGFGPWAPAFSVNRSTLAVGVGTAAPTGSLEVSSATPVLKLRNKTGANTDTADIAFATAGATDGSEVRSRIRLSVDSAGSGEVSIWTGAPNALADRLHINAAGFVGLGWSSPFAPLHIQGNNTTNNPEAGILLSRFTATSSNMRASAIFHYFNATNSADTLAFAVSNTPSALALAQIKMVITDGGRVGVGVTAPLSTLHVVGPSTSGDVTTAKQLLVDGAGGAGGYNLQLGNAVVAGYWCGVVQSIAGSAPAYLLLNPQGGNVSIGNVAPAYALDVTGVVRTTSMFRGPDALLGAAALVCPEGASLPLGSIANGSLVISHTVIGANHQLTIAFRRPDGVLMQCNIGIV